MMVNNLTKPLILCVDDDEVTLKLLDRLIKNAGWDVITAESGRDAIEKVKKTRQWDLNWEPWIISKNRSKKEILLLRVERMLEDRGRWEMIG